MAVPYSDHSVHACVCVRASVPNEVLQDFFVHCFIY
jgi:hypothetical protein